MNWERFGRKRPLPNRRTNSEFAGGTERTHEGPQSECTVPRQRLEPANGS
jgi:hypothetical protein